MPHSDLHKKQRGKNYAVLGALVLFAVTVFFVSIIRMKGG
jgi:hypothetical protein